MRYEGVIRSSFRVVSVATTEFQVICPWHQDRSGKLYINGVTGLYLCMRCGAKGGLDKMQDRPVVLGTDDVREKIKRMAEKNIPVHVYPDSWLLKFDFPHDYWTGERGLPEDVVKLFRLGYDPLSNRMTIPLRDADGRVLGVTYRRLDDQKPKYLHPKGFPTGKYLFGAWLVTDQKRIALVEGQVDAIRCWSERVPALALMGARLTADQKRVLERMDVQTVVLMLDNDSAGFRGTLGVAETLADAGMRVLVAQYRDYWFDGEGRPVKDPDGLSGTRLRKAFHSAVPIQEWARNLDVH